MEMPSNCSSVVSLALPLHGLVFLVGGCVSIWCNWLLYSLLNTAPLIPGNVRLLLLQLVAGQAIAALFYVYYPIYLTLLTIYPHGLSMSPSLCGLFCSCYVFGGVVAMSTLCILAIERAIVYYVYDSVEESEKSSWAVRIMVGLCWIVGVLTVGGTTVITAPLGDLCFCHPMLSMPTTIAYCSFMSHSASLIGSFLLFLLILYSSKRQYDQFGLNHAKSSLSRRFQLYVCIDTTRGLLPIVSLGVCLCPATFVIWLVLEAGLREDPTSGSINIFLLSHYLILTYNTMCPLLILVRHRKLHKALYSHWPRIFALLRPLRLAKTPCAAERVTEEQQEKMVFSHHAGPDEAKEIYEMFWYK